MKTEIHTLGSFEFLVRYPNHYKEGETYPVILMLHGSGGRGSDMNMIINDNPYFVLTEKMEDFPFITVAPQCNLNSWFDHFESLRELVRWVANAPFTDPARIYGAGMSMGGYGIWQLAQSMPEYFAAIVPICGGGMAWNSGRLINVPVWAHHGDSDRAVDLQESVRMVEMVNKKGGNAKLTIYENTGHNAWTPCYTNPEVYEWLLSHTNQNAKELKEQYTDQKIYG